MRERIFDNRAHAGRELARELASGPPEDAVVYDLARGGVPVAAVIASELNTPLDALLVRKIGAPGNPELALGAVTSSGGTTVNERVAAAMNVSSVSLGLALAARDRGLANEGAAA